MAWSAVAISSVHNFFYWVKVERVPESELERVVVGWVVEWSWHRRLSERKDLHIADSATVPLTGRYG